MTTRTMMIMTKTAIIPPKTAGVVLLPAVLMGISGDVAGVVGQLHVEGCCVSTTPEDQRSTVNKH